MRAAPAVLALSAVLALAGCSLSSPSSAGSAGATASTSTATTSSSAEATARPSASASGSAAPSVPAGHQAITAPTVGVTFAVPEDWQDLNALTEDQKTLIARVQGVGPTTFSQELASTEGHGLYATSSITGWCVAEAPFSPLSWLAHSSAACAGRVDTTG